MIPVEVEPRAIVWGVTRCAYCLRRLADATFDGMPCCEECGWLQVEGLIAAEFAAGHGARGFEWELQAEERQHRLPPLRPAPGTVEVCPRCKRSEWEADWMNDNGWPSFCARCRWSV